ncbi:GNAT superfamily N-acetyltransferase [Microbacterium foliorum]|uniref:GNAT family N-acetyltransferase n=1 Tax=Microbacterium foliorum TaxID=104336 RepID=UPI00209C7C9E|nr:GNAT family N-acetyltransferase [Microbacterium foliorum]MCP1430240.1 GNAT superfamily N-acetyltransferase [Microbacterium foliorum]
MSGRVLIRLCDPDDPAKLHEAFAAVGWDKPVALFERYLHEHAAMSRHLLLAEVDGTVAGYVTLVWKSEYPPFAEEGIPEVSDLNVLPRFRRSGIASGLLDQIEQAAAQRSSVVGLGVGLYADYGAAQRIYVRRGYIPDGRGVMYENQPVPAGETVPLDDDATLMFTKQIDRHP